MKKTIAILLCLLAIGCEKTNNQEANQKNSVEQKEEIKKEKQIGFNPEKQSAEEFKDYLISFMTNKNIERYKDEKVFVKLDNGRKILLSHDGIIYFNEYKEAILKKINCIFVDENDIPLNKIMIYREHEFNNFDLPASIIYFEDGKIVRSELIRTFTNGGHHYASILTGITITTYDYDNYKILVEHYDFIFDRFIKYKE